MPESHSVWNKGFVLVNLIFFLIFSNISFFYLYPLALKAMGTPNYMIGLVVGLFSAVTVISRPFMGKAVSRRGESPIILIGILTVFMASLGYVFAHSVGLFTLLTRAVHGLGFSAFIAGSFSLVARTFPPTRRAQAYGVVGAALMSASALSPPIGETLIKKWGFSSLYLAACLSAAVAFVLMWTTRRRLLLPSKDQHTSGISYRKLIKDRSLFCVLLSTLIFAHCQSTVINFVALLAISRHSLSGPFFTYTFATAIFFLLAFANRIDRLGKRLFLRLSYPLLVLGLFLIPATLGGDFASLTAVMFGAALGLLFPVHNALAADHGSISEKAGVMSLFTATYDTGFVTGAMVSGWVAQQLGLDQLFVLTSALALGGFFAVLLAPIKSQQSKNYPMGLGS